MFSSIHSLLETSFFPCSPLASSLGLSQSSQFWTWAWVRSLLLEETGLAALDSEDEVVGVLLGKHSLLMDLTPTERLVDFIFGGGWEEFLGEWIVRLCWYLNWLLPSYYADYTYGLFRDIEERLGYEENKIMTNLNCGKVRGSGSGGFYHYSSVTPCVDGGGVPAVCRPEVPEARPGHQTGPAVPHCSLNTRLWGGRRHRLQQILGQVRY